MSTKNKSKKPVKQQENVSDPIFPGLIQHKFFTWFSVILIMAMTWILRGRLLDIPFERDEGGFAYMGYSWIHGTPLFTDYVDVKPPLIYILYSIFGWLFGENPQGVHTGLLLFNLGFSLTFFLFSFSPLSSFQSFPQIFLFFSLSLSHSLFHSRSFFSF